MCILVKKKSMCLSLGADEEEFMKARKSWLVMAGMNETLYFNSLF